MHYHHKNHTGSILGIGLLGFALGAVAGALLAPKSGKESREQMTNWANNFSEELNSRVHNMRDMTVEKYNSTIDDIAYKYRKMNGIKQSELNDFISDLKMRWDRIKDQWRNDEPVQY